MLESRKDFLRRCCRIVPASFGVGIIINACNSNKTESKNKAGGSSGEPCEDLSGISANDLESRQKLNYVAVSPLKNKICEQCNLYIPPKPGSNCGGCMLFKGPVKPGGSCTYWTAKLNQ